MIGKRATKVVRPMIRFFRTVKFQDTLKQLVKPTSVSRAILLAVISIGALSACEPNHSTTDEAQNQVAAGNVKLVRMEQIDKELRAAGVIILHPGLSTQVVSERPEGQLIEWRKLVHEYIGHAQEVLKIADRPDVSFGEKQKISDGLSGANRLLEMLETQIGKIRHPQYRLDATFWSEWSQCQEWAHRGKNRAMFGIEFVLIENQQSVRIEDHPSYYARLGREKRRLARLAARRHIDCLNLAEIYSRHTNPNQNFSDESSELAKIHRQRTHLRSIIEALSESPVL